MGDVSYRLVITRLAEQWQLTEGQYRCLLTLPADAAPELLKIDNTLKQLFATSPYLLRYG